MWLDDLNAYWQTPKPNGVGRQERGAWHSALLAQSWMLPPKPARQDGWHEAVTSKPPKPPPNATQHMSPPVQFSPLPQVRETPGPQGACCDVHEVDAPPPRPPTYWMQHCWVAASQVAPPHGIVPTPPAPLDEPAPLLLLLPPPLDELELLLP